MLASSKRSNREKMSLPPVKRKTPVVPVSKNKKTEKGGKMSQFTTRSGTTKTKLPRTPVKTKTFTSVVYKADTGASILQDLIDVWGGDEDKINELAELQYPNGDHIIDPKRKDIITEVVGMIISQGYQEVLEFLSQATNPEYVIWEQKFMEEGKNKVIREIEIQQTEQTGVKGVGKCRFCASTELVFTTKQLRSGDEPATIFFRCVMCQKQWRQ